MRAPERRGAIQTTFNRVNDGGQPVSHIQRGRFTRQQVIAQGAQHLGQVAEQDLGGGVVLALPMAANHRNQPVGGGALGVEVVESGSVWVGVGLVGDCR